ncbi:carbohydrate ABC transporter permease [Glycomyces buryatensis]|uniref:Carbohydrate ABC transporter permease n=1 Tax=Glycomyces buryatensis TaxID=2570927 RepID=A0A4V4HSG3_9ACTN|nr:carbohydrate ABC transporter permease [Glycomyces buryatensis]THV41636.1 carbohydrate ABC transporter permease [Glycomyces buryatensis]
MVDAVARRARWMAFYILLAALAITFSGPLGWLILTALKAPNELSVFPIQLFPESPQWHNFADALTFVDFLGYARNSMILSTLTAVLTTISSAWMAYGFARLSAPGKKFWFGLLISTMMMPSIVTLIPTYLMFAKMGLVDTYVPWILWGLSGAAFMIFLFRQFFSGIPKELEEAAVLDGCGHVRIFWQIFLPQSWPMLAACMVLTFTGAWGDFIAPSLLLSDDTTTLAVALTRGYVNEQGFPVQNLLAAGSTMFILPVLLIFLFFQRFFVQGFSTSGLK